MATSKVSKVKTKVTFGADPEFFLAEKESGKIIPACGKVGGGKKNAVLLSPDGGYLEDGAVVEFNVSPSESLIEVATKLRGLMALFLTQHPNYDLKTDVSHKFTKAELEANPQASVLGCEPDFYAWGIRELPQASYMGQYRFAGGHIHVGLDPWPEGLEKDDFIKYLDVCWLMPNYKGQDDRRIQYYGHPGLYRETPYGVEYRSPDSAWVFNDAMSGGFDHLVRKLVKKSENDKQFGERLAVAIEMSRAPKVIKLVHSNEWRDSKSRLHGTGFKSLILNGLEM